MVSEGISLQAHTKLVYRENLEPHIVPFAPFIGKDIIFMHDNVRSETVRIVGDFLDEVNVNF